MVKCLTKLNTVQGPLMLMHNVDDAKFESGKLHEFSTTELVHGVEGKLSRILDVINREKAEHELHRSENNNSSHAPSIHHHTSGGSSSSSGPNIHVTAESSRIQPSPNESEEHFILRVSTADTSQGNIRVH
jgi:hypothetical protein